MAGILLTILKIAGIALGSILLAMLLLLLAVLFCAVKYKAVFSYNEEFQGRLKVSWLFKIIFLRLEWQESRLGFCLRVFGLPLFSNRRREKKEKKKKRGKKRKPYELKKEESKYEFLELELDEGEEATDEKIAEIPRSDADGDKTRRLAKRKFSPARLGAQIKKTWEQAKKKCRGSLDKARDLRERGEALKEAISSYRRNQERRAFFRMAGKRLLKAIRGILPRKYHLRVRFGGGDPATTGRITGYYAIVRSIFAMRVDFEPDFEQAVFMLEGYARGRIRVISLAAALLKIITHKQFRIIYRQLRKR